MAHNLHYARALLNPYLLGETRLHDDVDVKQALNKILQKTIHASTTYALILKKFIDFVEIQGPFSDTPPSEGPRLFPMQVVGFDWI
jgi:hypothetical protein